MSKWNSRRSTHMSSNPPLETPLEAAVRRGRASWPPGPWTKEPDTHKWMEGLVYCVVIRAGESGHFCGYLGCQCPSMSEELGLLTQLAVDAPVTWEPKYGSPVEEFLGETDPVRGLVWLGWDAAHSFNMTPEKAAAYAKKGKGFDVSEYVTFDQAVDRTRRCGAHLDALCALLMNGGMRFRTY